MQETQRQFKEKALQMYADAARGSSSRLAFLEAVARMLQAKHLRESLPKVVCLCGSTRFYQQFQSANFQFTMKGYIVLTVGFYPHAQEEMHEHGETVGITAEDKVKLDELHKRKIDLCDFVYVIDVDGYIGESTRSEIAYALDKQIPVRYRSQEYAIFTEPLTKVGHGG